MASLADWIKSQTADYGQLKNAYPNAMKFGSALKKGINDLVPTQEDLNSPQKMGEWGLSAALNAPMGMMFVGPKSAGWDAVKAQEAEKLLNAGVDPAQVWKEHLIGRMPDKSLFSEISDAESRAIPKQEWNATHQKQHEHGQDAEWQMSGFFNHPELQQSYPSIGGQLGKPYDLLSTRFSVSGLADQRGHYLPERDSIHIGMNPLNKNEIDKSIALHEIQHAIQNQEGWARGGSPDNPPLPFMEEINNIRAKKSALDFDPYAISNQINNGRYVPDEKLLKYNKWKQLQSQEDDLLDQALKVTPMEAYRRLTGEAQARATQDRMNMNMQQRRESYPLANDMLSDIPLGNLINRYGE